MEIGIGDVGKRCRERFLEFDDLRKRCIQLESENDAIRNEFNLLKRRNEELEDQITQLRNGNEVSGVVDLTGGYDEEDEVLRLMIENKVLECEKVRAEDEVALWKAKFNELSSRMNTNTRESTHFKVSYDLEMNTTPSHMDRNTSVSEKRMDSATGAILTCSQTDAEDANQQTSGIPSIDTPCKKDLFVEGESGGIHYGTNSKFGSQVKRRLPFEEAGNTNKKMAPSTPAGLQPSSVGVIDIRDSDDEQEPDCTLMPTFDTPKAIMNSENNLERNRRLQERDKEDMDVSGKYKSPILSIGRTRRTPSKIVNSDSESDEEDMDVSGKDRSPILSISKRRRASKIVNSDTEGSDDDNTPIGMLRTQHMQKPGTDSNLSSSSQDEVIGAVTRRRRLVKLRKREVEKGPEINTPRPNNVNLSKHIESDHETFKSVNLGEISADDSGSESEGESLSGFIVDDPVSSESMDSSNDLEDKSVEDTDISSDTDSNLSSSSNKSYNEIISGLGSRRKSSEWELEGDMLRDFNNDPELCMKAVCCLYRKQTMDEKSCKGTIHLNNRGFSQADASRGTKLAEFLTGGDPNGDLTKSVEELEAHDSMGIQLCRKLATKYSNQLFTIYSNNEDPFFRDP